MDKTTKLYNLIYDKLVNNTNYEQFEPEMADEMELVYNANTGVGEYIDIVIDGTTYTLTITPTHRKGE